MDLGEDTFGGSRLLVWLSPPSPPDASHQPDVPLSLSGTALCPYGRSLTPLHRAAVESACASHHHLLISHHAAPLLYAAERKDPSRNGLLLDYEARPAGAVNSRTLDTYVESWTPAKVAAALQAAARVQRLEKRKQAKKQKQRRRQTKQIHSVEVVADDQCVCCMEHPTGILFLPCGHLIMCEQCAAQLMSYSSKLGMAAICPDCSEPILQQFAMSV